MLDAIDTANPGAVYVMVLDDGADYAGIGGLMATAMKYRGLAGAIIDGSVRDTPQIRKLQFPVFSRGVVPSTTINHYRFVGTNVPVTCAGVRVNAGDITAGRRGRSRGGACARYRRAQKGPGPGQHGAQHAAVYR